jgi:hypothetical protein
MAARKHKQRHRTAKEMYAHLARWEQSGQSQRDYMLASGLSKSVFNYWLRRYRAERGVGKGAEAGFVAVTPMDGAPRRSTELSVFARIQYPDGREVVLLEAVPSGYLRDLLA